MFAVYTYKQLQNCKYMFQIDKNKLIKYGLDSKTIGKMFNYSSDGSFRNSSAHDRILSAVSLLIKHVEKQIIKDLDS